MIRADVLREFRPAVRYQNGNGITLYSVQEAIKECASNLGIPVAFKKDQVKSGGLFNSSVEDCIVMYHPEHEMDYFNFCVRIKRQGLYAFILVNDFGRSPQMEKSSRSNYYKEDRKGKSMSYKVGSMIGELVTSVGANKEKLEEEQSYYQCIFDIFDEVIAFK